MERESQLGGASSSRQVAVSSPKITDQGQVGFSVDIWEILPFFIVKTQASVSCSPCRHSIRRRRIRSWTGSWREPALKGKTKEGSLVSVLKP